MIYVLSGGGSGCTLVVTGVAGDTCTITNSSTGKSNSKTFDANKQATFKGLATGTWTVKMTGSSGTATRSVTINADYTCTITYFSATINITYPEASVCTITNSSGETVASDSNSSTSSTKTFTATVGATGTYTITSASSDGANTAADVVITTDGQSETVTLSYRLFIFREGSGLENGFAVSMTIDYSGYEITKQKIVWSTSTSMGNVLWITPQMDLSPYKTLHFDFKRTDTKTTSSSTIGVGPDTPPQIAQPGTFTAKTEVAHSTKRGVYSVDLSKISTADLLYIKFAAFSLTGEIYNIWLS